MQTAVGRVEPLAFGSTLCRLEATTGGSEAAALNAVLVDVAQPVVVGHVFPAATQTVTLTS